MIKLNVQVQELASGYVVTFRTIEPGSAGTEHACTTLQEVMDIILETNDELKEKANGTC
jgi:hypothetical protein